MLSKTYMISSAVVAVDYDGRELTAKVMSNNRMFMNAFCYRQEEIYDKLARSGMPADKLPEWKINVDGNGSVLIKFKSKMDLIKFSNWIISDNAIKQIRNSYASLELQNNQDYDLENLIEECHNI